MWALVSTGVAAWILLRPASPTQTDIWRSDEYLLGLLGSDFQRTAQSLAQLVLTHDRNWSLAAEEWVENARALIGHAPDDPGGFPSALALGFNATGMCVASGILEALDQQFASGYFYPSNLAEAEGQRSAYENLTTRMEVVRIGLKPGENPLDTLGTADVTAIHQLLTSMWSAAFAASFLTPYYCLYS